MSDFQSIILCATPRSGSTMLCDLMTATGVLGRPASYYRPESISDWARQLGDDTEVGGAEFERAYLAAIRAHGTDASGTFGLRVMWDTMDGLTDRLSSIFPDAQSDAALFDTAFGRPLYVHLVREDKVAQAVSLVRAEQSGLWHLASDGSVRQGAKETKPNQYDARAIEKEIAALTRDDAAWQSWFAAHNLKPVSVDYENLASDQRSEVTTILKAVGENTALAEELEPATAKIADAESQSWIERFRQERS